MKFEFDPPAIGIPDVGRPVPPVGSESLTRLSFLDGDARLAELGEKSLDRFESVHIVRTKEETDVFATHIERPIDWDEMEMAAAGDDRNEREFVVLELLSIPDRQAEQVVIERQGPLDIADADRDVVDVSDFDHGEGRSAVLKASGEQNSRDC